MSKSATKLKASEIACQSGMVLKLRLNDSTMRLVFSDPLIVKMVEGSLIKEIPSFSDSEALQLWEKLDNVAARIVSEPRLFVPTDLEDEVPGGMVSIEELTIADKVEIWKKLMAAWAAFSRMGAIAKKELE